MLDGWRGFGVARRGLSALARGVDTHDIIPTPPFRILSLTSSEKASLFQSPAAILGRKSPSAALSKLGYPAQVGSPTICGVFCIKVDNKLRNKSVLVLEPVESQGGRMVARKRGTSTCRLSKTCRHSGAPAENGQYDSCPAPRVRSPRTLPKTIVFPLQYSTVYLCILRIITIST